MPGSPRWKGKGGILMVGELIDPRKEFGKAVTRLAATNKNIVVFSADSGKSSGFADFIRLYPDRYFECGIEEQGVVGMAAGMASAGKIPVFCAIAPFVTSRPYEMVRDDVGYMEQNVKLVGRNCGITYSDLGFTHQSIDDFGLMRLIPGMTIIAPQDPVEIDLAVAAMIEHVGPVYMRVGNPKIPVLFKNCQFEIGKGRIISEGSDVTVISTGSSTLQAMKAQKILAEKGIHVQLIGMPTVMPLDTELVRSSAEKTGKIVTVEEHFAEGGLGSIVTEAVSDMKDVVVKRIGIPRIYPTTCSEYERLLSFYGLDGEGIARNIEEFVRGK
jgi:transketolase